MPNIPTTTSFFDNIATYEDAKARVRRAALEHECDMNTLKVFEHPSDEDIFFEGTSKTGQGLFFKAHLGANEKLQDWAEPSSARWAERAGCGAKVFPTETQGLLVTERLPGRSMTRAEGGDPFFARQVARHLLQLHNTESGNGQTRVPCTTGGARGRIRDAIRDGKISHQLASDLLRKADWLDTQFDKFTIESKRRFGDCHFGNWIVVDKHLYAIDLADSAYGDPLGDLARYSFCQRFKHGELQTLLNWYCEGENRTPSKDEQRRLRLHATAQNLDYFGYFASLTGVTSAQTQNLASRILDDEAADTEYPRGDFKDVFVDT